MSKTLRKRVKGFTLTELLLVIGIIGFLASILVVVMGQAKAKARDGGIKANLSQIRHEATSIYEESGSYTATGNELCDSGNPPTLNENNLAHPLLGRIESEVWKRNGQRDIICYASQEKYCVESPLASSGYFCVDSIGRALEVETPHCDEIDYDCL